MYKHEYKQHKKSDPDSFLQCSLYSRDFGLCINPMVECYILGHWTKPTGPKSLLQMLHDIKSSRLKEITTLDDTTIHPKMTRTFFFF